MGTEIVKNVTQQAVPVGNTGIWYWACAKGTIEAVFNYAISWEQQAGTVIYGDPIEYIYRAQIYPFSILSATTTARKYVTLARNPASTSIVSNLITSFNGVINGGEFTLNRHFNSFLDFAPYTKIELFIPYVGFVNIDPMSIYGSKITISYVVNFVNGSATAVIERTKNNERAVISTYNAQMGVDIEWSMQNINSWAADLTRGMASMAFNAIPAMAAAHSIRQMPAEPMFDNGADAAEWKNQQAAAQPQRDASANTYLTNYLLRGTASTMQGMYTTADHTQPRGQAGSANSMYYLPQNPYLIITRPVVNQPLNYNKLYGRPLYETRTLSDLTGFTVVDSVHLENIAGATAIELKTIETALNGGVIL